MTAYQRVAAEMIVAAALVFALGLLCGLVLALVLFL
jgi:hypothetical protein